MSDDHNKPAHMADQPTYQTPDWETGSRRPGRLSFLGRFLPSSSLSPDKQPAQASEKGSVAAPPSSALPTVATRGAAPLPPQPQSPRQPTGGGGGDHYDHDHERHVAALSASPSRGAAHPSSSSSSPSPSMRERFDAILPPNRTYLGGRSRRFLLLFVILPLALLLFLILPIALGLGLGLSSSHRSSSSSSDDLPLPTNQDTFTGDITYYDPGLGACGIVSSSSDAICAVSQIIFDAAGTGSTNPNANPLCGKRIRVTRDFVEQDGAGNRSVDVTVVDRCTGCASSDLDLTSSVFDQLAPAASGRVVASWAWLN